ncbi:hypothetical protein [Nocardioides sp. KR10-350]|uniref:hypothetical protein n=1 Tax=Nocardioides cheoyonin TaxID=3156615 RepID=UPI0032B527DC
MTATAANVHVVRSAKRIVHLPRAYRYKATVWVTARGTSTGHQAITVTSCDDHGVPHPTRYPGTVRASVTRHTKVTIARPHWANSIRIAKAQAVRKARKAARTPVHAKALRLVTAKRSSLTARARALNSFVVSEESLVERGFVSSLNAQRKAAGLAPVTWSTEIDGLADPAARTFVLDGVFPHPGPSDLPSAGQCSMIGVGTTVLDGWTTPQSGNRTANAQMGAKRALAAFEGNATARGALFDDEVAATRIAVAVWTDPDSDGNQDGAIVLMMLGGDCPGLP